MATIEELKAQKQAAANDAHAITNSFATRLVKFHFRYIYKAVDKVNETLRLAGFPTNIQVRAFIEYRKDWPILKCTLCPMIPSNPHELEYVLTLEEKVAYERAKAESDVVWKRYQALDKEIMAAERAAYQSREQLNYDELLAKVSADHEAQEVYYAANGPRKSEQEDYTGVQVVSMNVEYLTQWLNDASEDFNYLDNAQRRKIWEASAFHFGIMGYTEKDADFYWDEEEKGAHEWEEDGNAD